MCVQKMALTIKRDLNLQIPMAWFFEKAKSIFVINYQQLNNKEFYAHSTLVSISTFRFFGNFLILFESLTPLHFLTFSQPLPNHPSNPSPNCSHNHSPKPISKSLSLYSPILSNCSHFCLVSLLSSDCTFDLPSFFLSLLILSKLLLLLDPLASTLSIAH